MSNLKKFDFIIIGAGIAGLAIAELLQRSGMRVLILEKEEKICSRASAFQQGWFHSGALYAALPDKTFFVKLVENLDCLFKYYRCFENMNLRKSKTIYPMSNTGWFLNRSNFYAYASPISEEVAPFMKLPWWFATLNAQRNLSRFEDFDPKQELKAQLETNRGISKTFKTCIFPRHKRKKIFSLDLGQLNCVLSSIDRVMDSRLIAIDLLRSFVGNDGKFRLSSEVTKVYKGLVVSKDGETFKARHVVVAAGDRSGVLLEDDQLIVVKSPQAVVVPALCSLNFVRMTPTMSETFNHIFHKHDHDKVEYSVIGNATYYDNNEISKRDGVHQALREKIKIVFQDELNRHSIEFYDGVKTERVGVNQLRNYQSHIVDKEHCTLVLPGKFSLAFSLAVKLCQHFGIEPLEGPIMLASNETGLDELIAYPKHFEIAKKLKEGSLQSQLDSMQSYRKPTNNVLIAV